MNSTRHNSRSQSCSFTPMHMLTLSQLLNLHSHGSDWNAVGAHLGEFNIWELSAFQVTPDPMGALMNAWMTRDTSTPDRLYDVLVEIRRDDVRSRIFNDDKTLKTNDQLRPAAHRSYGAGMYSTLAATSAYGENEVQRGKWCSKLPTLWRDSSEIGLSSDSMADTIAEHGKELTNTPPMSGIGTFLGVPGDSASLAELVRKDDELSNQIGPSCLLGLVVLRKVSAELTGVPGLESLCCIVHGEIIAYVCVWALVGFKTSFEFSKYLASEHRRALLGDLVGCIKEVKPNAVRDPAQLMSNVGQVVRYLDSSVDLRMATIKLVGVVNSAPAYYATSGDLAKACNRAMTAECKVGLGRSTIDEATRGGWVEAMLSGHVDDNDGISRETAQMFCDYVKRERLQERHLRRITSDVLRTDMNISRGDAEDLMDAIEAFTGRNTN